MELVDNPPTSAKKPPGGLRDELRRITQVDADPSHWNPFFRPLKEDPQHDRFGNRFMVSLAPYGFQDSTGEVARAGLLVSPDGKQVVQKYRTLRFLREIDHGLRHILFPPKTASGETVPPVTPNHYTDATNQLSLDPIGRGDYSQVYVCTIDKRGTGNKPEKYIVKVPSFKDRDMIPKYPFMKQMLQKQSLQKDLGEVLGELGVEIPQIYAASSSVMIEEYIEGVKPDEGARPKIEKALKRIEEYIKDQRSQDPVLWSNTHVDLPAIYGNMQNVLYDPVRGTHFLIDPLYY